MAKAIVFSVFLLSWGWSHAQSDFLMLQKSGSTKRKYFHIGDYMEIKPVNDFPMKRGILTALSDSALYMGSDSTRFSEIDFVYLGDKKGIFPKQLWWINLASTSVMGLFYQAPYLMKGEVSHDFRNVLGVIAVVTVVPPITNGLIMLFQRNKLYVREDEWRLSPVILP